MKKLLYTFLAASIIFSACKKEEETNNPPTVAASWDCDGQGNCSDPGTGNGVYNDSLVCVASCNTLPTVYDTLVGFWNLTHYDIGNGLEVADTGQYINFLDDIELLVNVGVPGWTWTGSFNYDATSDSIHTMFQDISIVTLDNLNMTLHNIGSFSDYDLYFEK